MISPPPSDSEDDDTLAALASATWAPGARGCSDLTSLQQPAPTSHLVAMVCSNCLITHTLKDCIIDSASDDGDNMLDIISLSDGGSSDYGVISLIGEDDDGLAPIIEAPGLESWSDSEPSEETGDSQPPHVVWYVRCLPKRSCPSPARPNSYAYLLMAQSMTPPSFRPAAPPHRSAFVHGPAANPSRDGSRGGITMDTGAGLLRFRLASPSIGGEGITGKKEKVEACGWRGLTGRS